MDVDGVREKIQQERNTNEKNMDNYLLNSRTPSTPVVVRLGPAL